MPCSDGGYGRDEYRENPETKRKLDHVTRMLCKACDLADYGEDIFFLELRAWWDQHQELDRKRQAAEEVADQRRKAERRHQTELLKHRANALSKLTEEERDALGV